MGMLDLDRMVRHPEGMNDWEPAAAFVYQHPSGENVGPVRCEPGSVDEVARECVRLSGGSASILERAGGGWRMVRRYA